MDESKSDIPRWVAFTAHVIVVTGLIAMADVIVLASTGSRLVGIMFVAVSVPAWLTVELIRWINRCGDSCHANHPPDAP